MSCVSSAWKRITAILKRTPRASARRSGRCRLDSGRPGKTVLLIGHLDTVDVSDRWKTDPFTPTEIDGKVYGRGAMDMKGGLAAIPETLTYYAAHLDEINGKILACFVADEEGLSKGHLSACDGGRHPRRLRHHGRVPLRQCGCRLPRPLQL